MGSGDENDGLQAIFFSLRGGGGEGGVERLILPLGHTAIHETQLMMFIRQKLLEQ